MGVKRKAWIDVARGTAIILVTLMHVSFIVEAATGGNTGVWPEVNRFFRPLRMPLFFIIAGSLAANAVRRPLSMTTPRTIGLAWVYFLWSALQAVHLALTLAAENEGALGVGEVVTSFLAPTGVWFFYALVLYFLVARAAVVALHRWAPLILLPAAAVSASAGLLEGISTVDINPGFGFVYFGSVYSNVVWYFAGLFGLPVLAYLRRVSTPLTALLAVAVYSLGYHAINVAWVPGEFGWLLSAFAVAAAVMVLAVLPLTSRLSQAIAAVGRRTLPIYAVQWLFLDLLTRLVVATDILDVLGDPDVVASVVSPIVATLIVALSWWFGGVATRGRLAFLFQAPRRLLGTARQQKTPSEGAPVS